MLVVAAYATYRFVDSTPEAPPPPTVETQPEPARTYRHASFAGEAASADARALADWVVDSRDNRNMSFAIIDKRDAKVYVFDAKGELTGASPVLLGLARGDDSAPGIGLKKLSEITPDERTTPTGRYVAEPGVNLKGEKIVWVDYDAALSMHAVRATNPKERRLERLATPTPADNRISYGCINVPTKFYREVIMPTFGKRKGVVYVLPETRPARAVFAAWYDVPPPSGPSTAALTLR